MSAGETTQGRRVEWADERIPVEQEKLMGPGDYAGPWRGMWLLCAPNGAWGSLQGKHTITEHEDGTITVAPSILIYKSVGWPEWHGYLERGAWREV